MQLGVAAKVTTLDKTHFVEVERIGILLKNRRTSAAASAAASLAGVKGPDDLPLRPEVSYFITSVFHLVSGMQVAVTVSCPVLLLRCIIKAYRNVRKVRGMMLCCSRRGR